MHLTYEHKTALQQRKRKCAYFRHESSKTHDLCNYQHHRNADLQKSNIVKCNLTKNILANALPRDYNVLRSRILPAISNGGHGSPDGLGVRHEQGGYEHGIEQRISD